MFRGWYYFRNFANRNLRIEFSAGNNIMSIEEECKKNNIIIITSAPTFEIWYIIHYRNNRLKFQTSKEVKKELQNLNITYKESMDMYKIIKDSTNSARITAKAIEQQIIRNNEELLSSNPHTSIYKILEAIDEFNNLDT